MQDHGELEGQAGAEAEEMQGLLVVVAQAQGKTEVVA